MTWMLKGKLLGFVFYALHYAYKILCREVFEKLSEPLVSRFEAVIRKCIADSGIETQSLFAIEVVGGGLRSLPLVNSIEGVVEKKIAKSLNYEESVAKGCALQVRYKSL